MKFIMIVGDGMADHPIDALGGRTPLAHMDLPNMRTLAGGETGRLRTCPQGLPPGSDVAFLTLTGNDPRTCYTGRAALEAAGVGASVNEGETAFRMNLITLEGNTMRSHNGSGVSGEEALELARFVGSLPTFRAANMRITSTTSFRHTAVLPRTGAFPTTPPHDIANRDIGAWLPKSECLRALIAAARQALPAHPINRARMARGEAPVNAVWFWGAGTGAHLIDFASVYGIRGAVVSAVPLVRGIAKLCGMDAPEDERFTGLLDTAYEEKAALTARLLREGADFALLHVEAPDEMSHDGSLDKKLEAIRRLDSRAIGPLLEELSAMGDFRALLLPDHYTPLATRTHDATPVPYALYDSRRPGVPKPFCEALCAGEQALESGDALLRRLFDTKGDFTK